LDAEGALSSREWGKRGRGGYLRGGGLDVYTGAREAKGFGPE